MPLQRAGTTEEHVATNYPVRAEPDGTVIFSLPNMTVDTFYQFTFKGRNCAAVYRADKSLEVYEIR